MNKEEIKTEFLETLKNKGWDTDNVGYIDLINDLLDTESIKKLFIPVVSQRSEPLPLFADRHLQNGIAFTLIESGKLGKHPESKLIYNTTQNLKKWILAEFEIKKR